MIHCISCVPTGISLELLMVLNYASNKPTIVITIKYAVTGHVGVVVAMLELLVCTKCS